MLLQGFFASARLHRVHKIFSIEECSLSFVPHKSNNIIGQKKTINTKKNTFIHN